MSFYPVKFLNFLLTFLSFLVFCFYDYRCALTCLSPKEFLTNFINYLLRGACLLIIGNAGHRTAHSAWVLQGVALCSGGVLSCLLPERWIADGVSLALLSPNWKRTSLNLDWHSESFQSWKCDLKRNLSFGSNVNSYHLCTWHCLELIFLWNILFYLPNIPWG